MKEYFLNIVLLGKFLDEVLDEPVLGEVVPALCEPPCACALVPGDLPEAGGQLECGHGGGEVDVLLGFEDGAEGGLVLGEGGGVAGRDLERKV